MSTPAPPATNWTPKRKVVVGALAGAAMVILEWALSTFAHVNQPPEVVAAEVTVVSGVMSYLIPEGAQA